MNLFADLTPDPNVEIITPLVQRLGLRIERILSHGHTSPPGFWFDQAENEWVIVLRGRGIVEFEDGRTVELGPGDYLDIPAHTRHRVAFTDPGEVTLWLAVHDG